VIGANEFITSEKPSKSIAPKAFRSSPFLTQTEDREELFKTTPPIFASLKRWWRSSRCHRLYRDETRESGREKKYKNQDNGQISIEIRLLTTAYFF